tara:strand:- start:892 stop:1440 length:549 start_codon:yes stop_codon:yes gene_type:complete
MANSIQSFIDNFNGGNRSHRYDVELDWPTSVDVSGTQTSSQLDKFHVRSVALPASQINPIRIPYRGRILKYPGDRIFYPWTFRVLDENSAPNKSIWNNFNKWSNLINNYETNIPSNDWNEFTASEWKIYQKDANNQTIKTATLHDCWPTVVGPISLDANAIDTLVEFTVTVEYQWATIDGQV